MCTVSWFATHSGYELFFNRDESRQRAIATAPIKRTSNACDFLSPVDEEAGGSWISTNQFGVTVCLLNLYLESSVQPSHGTKHSIDYVSRGEIISNLADVSSLDEIYTRLDQAHLNQYRTFRVFAIDSSALNILLIWDGIKLTVEYDVNAPKSSSSVETEKVVQTRKDLFRQNQLNSSDNREAFFAYHKGHHPNKNYSVCVHREFTKTVSMSHIKVTEETVDFDYFDDSPCKCLTPLSSSLVRKMINFQSDVA